ncbi:MAG: hypothetical protein Q4E12_01170 [Coriobacteriia bacterium]|nr:hypothetical protein [Coriobacteriia bacterium]
MAMQEEAFSAGGGVLGKLFGGLRMTWPKLIVFAVVSGVYCGVINQIPAVHGTSLTDCAVSWELWVVLALIVSANCRTPLESALKCFVFFLISQPLVYLVEIPTLGHFPWEYLNIWMPYIVASVVAGFLAFYMRRQNALGLIITVCAAGCISLMGAHYLGEMIIQGTFPRHLLTILFDAVAAAGVVCVFQKKAIMRTIGITVAFVPAVVMLVYALMTAGAGQLSVVLEPGHTWEIGATANVGEATIETDPNGSQTLSATINQMDAFVVVCDEAGSEVTYEAARLDDGSWELRKK